MNSEKIEDLPLVKCPDCHHFSLIENFVNLGKCDTRSEAWKTSYTPGIGYGVSPMVHALPRRCAGFAQRPMP